MATDTLKEYLLEELNVMAADRPLKKDYIVENFVLKKVDDENGPVLNEALFCIITKHYKEKGYDIKTKNDLGYVKAFSKKEALVISISNYGDKIFITVATLYK